MSGNPSFAFSIEGTERLQKGERLSKLHNAKKKPPSNCHVWLGSRPEGV
jgi:hypothetical protein